MAKHFIEQIVALNSGRLVFSREEKKRKKRKKTTTILRRTVVSILDEGNKNSTLTAVLPPNVLMAIIQQIII